MAYQNTLAMRLFILYFIFGILSVSLSFPINIFWWLAISCVAILIVKKQFWIYFILILGFLGGFCWTQKIYARYSFRPDLALKEITVKGEIIRDPVISNSFQYLAVRSLDFKKYTSEDVFITQLPFYLSPEIGDIVLIKGTIDKATYNPFDIFLKNKITYSVNLLKCEFLKKKEGFNVFLVFSRLRNFIITKINNVFPPNEASLASMLLLGKNFKGYNQEISQTFNKAGISHLIVISGFHLTLIADILNYVFQFLFLSSFGLSFLNIVFMGCFVILVGFSASLIRAVIMSLLSIISRYFHRIYNATNSLLLSAFVILIINPSVLISDLGFQLSFLSVASLIFITPFISSCLSWIPQKRFLGWLKNALATSLAIFVGLMPFLIYKTGNVTLTMPLANLILVPLISILLFLLFINVLLLIFIYPLGKIFSFFSYLYLNLILQLASLFAKSKFSQYPLPLISIFWVLIYYIILIYALSQFYKKHRETTLYF